MTKLLTIAPLLMMSVVGLTACTPAPNAGFNDPATLQAEITTQVNTKLADKKDPNYAKGVKVTSVVCVSSAAHVFDCRIAASDKSNAVFSYVVAEDGSSFVAKAGQQ
jgi:hypothetical protein